MNRTLIVTLTLFVLLIPVACSKKKNPAAPQTPGVVLTSTPTLSATPTGTWYTATSTPTNTSTSSPTDTPLNTVTHTPTSTPTDSPTASPTSTPSDSPTNTPLVTSTFTYTHTPTGTLTPMLCINLTPGTGAIYLAEIENGNTLGTAQDLGEMEGLDILVYGGMSSVSDQDFYRFNTPCGTYGSYNIGLDCWSSGGGDRTFYLQLLDENGGEITSYANNDDLKLISTGLYPGLTYHVRVYTSGTGTGGGYRLSLDHVWSDQVACVATCTATETSETTSANDDIASAQDLGDAIGGAVARGHLDNAYLGDYYDYYSVTAPSADPGHPYYYQITLDCFDNGFNIDFNLRVLDSDSNAVTVSAGTGTSETCSFMMEPGETLYISAEVYDGAGCYRLTVEDAAYPMTCSTWTPASAVVETEDNGSDTDADEMGSAGTDTAGGRGTLNAPSSDVDWWTFTADSNGYYTIYGDCYDNGGESNNLNLTVYKAYSEGITWLGSSNSSDPVENFSLGLFMGEQVYVRVDGSSSSAFPYRIVAARTSTTSPPTYTPTPSICTVTPSVPVQAEVESNNTTPQDLGNLSGSLAVSGITDDMSIPYNADNFSFTNSGAVSCRYLLDCLEYGTVNISHVVDSVGVTVFNSVSNYFVSPWVPIGTNNQFQVLAGYAGYPYRVVIETP